jgi:hypothetical protein
MIYQRIEIYWVVSPTETVQIVGKIYLSPFCGNI